MDVLGVGPWPLLKDLEDPELRQLAEVLPSTLLQSRADSMTKKYLGAFKHWRLWAMEHKLPVFPAVVHHIVLYMQHLAESTRSKAATEEAAYVLAWAHTMAGVTSSTENPFVKTALEGLRRTLSKPVQKKEPITMDMLKAMVQGTIHC